MSILPGLPGGEPMSFWRQDAGLGAAATFRSDNPSPGKLVVDCLPERLASGERGLVVVPTMTPDIGDRLHVYAGIRSDFLKPALLFWDRIINPFSDLMEFDLSPDEEFLRSAGLLQQSSLQKMPGLTESEWLYAPEICFEALEAREPGEWCLFAENDVRPLPSRLIENDRGVFVDLHRSIAVPSGDVPFEDVLDFKDKRRDELQALRYQLSKLYEEILSAHDRELTSTAVFANLQKAISDELRVARESGMKTLVGSIKTSLSVGNVSGALLAFGGVVAAGLPIVQAVGAGASALSIGVGLGLKDRKTKDRPFAYVGAYHTDLRWS